MELRVSVVMATYNGIKYIKSQIDSIIIQLDKDDELIISDDGSSDGTREVIMRYAKKYENIHYINGLCSGYIKNFEYALGFAKNEIIMFSDQDDVWKENKIFEVKCAFLKNENAWLVVHDASYIDENGSTLPGTIFLERNAKKGFIRNLVRSMYYGCCMSLRSEYLKIILPFPFTIASYDQWIGLFAELMHRSEKIDIPLIDHRIHSNNQSTERSAIYRLWFRFIIVKYIIALCKRVEK